MAIFPGGVANNGDLVIAVNNKVTNLTAGIDNSTLTIPVTSTSGFPSVGYITIGTEVIHYTSVGATQFNADQRGDDGSTAAAHSNTDQVSQNNNAAFHNLLKDEIIAIEGHLNTVLGLNTNRIVTPGGSVTFPGVTIGEPGYGFYRRLATSTAVAQNGAVVWDFNNTNVRSYVDLQMLGGQILAKLGTPANPGMAFSGAVNTGFDGNASNMTAYVGGVNQWNWQTTGNQCNNHLTITGTFKMYSSYGTVSLPGYAFNGRSNQGMFSSSATSLAFAIGGDSQSVYFNQNQINWNIGFGGAATMQLQAGELAPLPDNTLNLGRGTTPYRWKGLFVGPGTLAAPSVSVGQSNDGLSSTTPGRVSVSTGGTERLRIDSNFIKGRIINIAYTEATGTLTNTSTVTPVYGPQINYSKKRTDSHLLIGLSGLCAATQSGGNGSGCRMIIQNGTDLVQYQAFRASTQNTGAGQQTGNTAYFWQRINNVATTALKLWRWGLLQQYQSGYPAYFNTDGTDNGVYTMIIIEYLPDGVL